MYAQYDSTADRPTAADSTASGQAQVAVDEIHIHYNGDKEGAYDDC